MKYICYRRFKGQGLVSEMNIPALSELYTFKDALIFGEKPVCFVESENGHQYFARNDDGNGLLRGKLTQAIQKTLEKRDEYYQDRWDKVWEDELCSKFKRKEHENFWLWNNEFFRAQIEELQYIADLIGTKAVD